MEGMIMENTMRIRMLKERIKTLTILQEKTKRARKTTMPKVEWQTLKVDILKSSGRTPDRDWWDHASAASDARLRKAEITACINLYHELRGSAHRHDFKEYPYWYEKYLKGLRTEIEKA